MSLSIENVFAKVDESISGGLSLLWQEEGVLTDPESISKRLKQVVFVVRDPTTNKLVGVSTSEKKKMVPLNNNFLYEFRCYISNQYRIAGLDVKLSKETFSFLETLSKSDPDKPVGIFSILENETLKKEPVWRRAVWPEIEMYFVGFTNSGNPIRVHYFKGARI